MRFARGLAAVLAAALAPAALLADSPAAGGAGSPPPRSAAPRALASVRVLYRIAGCRSRGAQAYRDVGASFRPTLLRELRDGIGIPRPELPRDALLQRAS